MAIKHKMITLIMYEGSNILCYCKPHKLCMTSVDGNKDNIKVGVQQKQEQQLHQVLPKKHEASLSISSKLIYI